MGAAGISITVESSEAAGAEVTGTGVGVETI
jgi:hypothetical protein